MIRRLGAAGTVLNKNRAHQTGLDGIEAIRGVTDLGGNKAKHDGNPAQCSPSIAC